MRIQSLFQILTLMTAPDSDSRTFIRKRPVQPLPDPVDDDEKTGLDVKVLLFCFIQIWYDVFKAREQAATGKQERFHIRFDY